MKTVGSSLICMTSLAMWSWQTFQDQAIFPSLGSALHLFSRPIVIKYKLDSEGKQETRVGLNVSYKPDIKESVWGSQEEDKVLKVESGLHQKVPAQR